MEIAHGVYPQPSTCRQDHANDRPRQQQCCSRGLSCRPRFRSYVFPNRPHRCSNPTDARPLATAPRPTTASPLRDVLGRCRCCSSGEQRMAPEAVAAAAASQQQRPGHVPCRDCRAISSCHVEIGSRYLKAPQAPTHRDATNNAREKKSLSNHLRPKSPARWYAEYGGTSATRDTRLEDGCAERERGTIILCITVDVSSSA